eukprot:TRINITY_DN7478_c0_g1_i1.p1 TRINITY_DN7478_c0_g1~~TRINITY_DN7478_c0_g1_i1.p1  ORF type:complete len:398 (-),score=64.83 TRINITY_DN7478_c0_g1_i1:149-1342(-)
MPPRRRLSTQIKKRENSSSPSVDRAAYIESILDSKPLDMAEIRRLAVGGLVKTKIRRKVWPLLLGLNPGETCDFQDDIRIHSYTDQVEKDVERSLWRFTAGISEEARLVKREALSRIINAILCKHSELHYFQGFHDIASVFLLVAGEDEAFPMVQRISLDHMRDSFNTTFESIQNVLKLVFPLIKAFDPPVYDFINKSEVDPAFALPWVLTWFAHHFDSFATVCRVYDFLLASHPLMHVYMSVASVLQRRDGLLAGDCEYAAVHCYLHDLPQNVDIEALITDAQGLMATLPPDELLRRANVSFEPGSGIMRWPYHWMPKPAFDDLLTLGPAAAAAATSKTFALAANKTTSSGSGTSGTSNITASSLRSITKSVVKKLAAAVVVSVAAYLTYRRMHST